MPGEPVTILDRAAYEAIRREARRTFPEEGCGFLIGPRGADRIDEARPMPNVHPSPRTTRYRIDALAYVHLEDEVEAQGRRLVGVFHSHPRHPATPSETDRAAAWPGLVYLIQATEEAGFGELLAWRLDKDGIFHPASYRVAGVAGATGRPGPVA